MSDRKKQQANLLMVLERINELEKGINKQIEIPTKRVNFKKGSKEYYSAMGHNHKRAPSNHAGRKKADIKPKAVNVIETDDVRGSYVVENNDIMKRPQSTFYSDKAIKYLMGECPVEDTLPPPYTPYDDKCDKCGLKSFKYPTEYCELLGTEDEHFCYDCIEKAILEREGQ